MVAMVTTLTSAKNL